MNSLFEDILAGNYKAVEALAGNDREFIVIANIPAYFFTLLREAWDRHEILNRGLKHIALALRVNSHQSGSVLIRKYLYNVEFRFAFQNDHLILNVVVFYSPLRVQQDQEIYGKA